jgi:uncharacterized protein YhaN
MAIADLITEDGCDAPLFLDDTFVQYDDERLNKALDFIIQESLRRQIFIFTCHKRIIEYIERNYINNSESKYTARVELI